MDVKMKPLIWIMFLVFQSRFADSQRRQWPVHVTTACYGLSSTFLYASCERGKHIVVKNVYANAKPRYTNCPEQSDDQIPIDPNCCICSQEDCKMEYSGVSKMNYYTECNGKQRCFPRVSWQPIGNMCSGKRFLLRSNYMVLEYFCVDDQYIIPEFFNDTELIHNKISKNFNPTLSPLVPHRSTTSKPQYIPVSPLYTDINNIPKDNIWNAQAESPVNSKSSNPVPNPDDINNPSVTQNNSEIPTVNNSKNSRSHNMNKNHNTTPKQLITDDPNYYDPKQYNTRNRTSDRTQVNLNDNNESIHNGSNASVDSNFIANHPSNFNDSVIKTTHAFPEKSSTMGSNHVTIDPNQKGNPVDETHKATHPTPIVSNKTTAYRDMNNNYRNTSDNPNDIIYNSNTTINPNSRQDVTSTTTNVINLFSSTSGYVKNYPSTAGKTNSITKYYGTHTSNNITIDPSYKPDADVTTNLLITTETINSNLSSHQNVSDNPKNSVSYPRQPQYPPVNDTPLPSSSRNGTVNSIGLTVSDSDNPNLNASRGVFITTNPKTGPNDSANNTDPNYTQIFNINSNNYQNTSQNLTPSLIDPNILQKKNTSFEWKNTTDDLAPPSCLVSTGCSTTIVIKVIGTVKCPFNLTIINMTGEIWYPCQFNSTIIDTESSVLFLYEENKIDDPEEHWLKFLSSNLITDVVLTCYDDLKLNKEMVPDCSYKINTTPSNRNIDKEILPGLVDWEVALVGIALMFIVTFIIMGIWIAYSRRKRRNEGQGRFRFPGYNPRATVTRSEERLVTPSNVTVRDQHAGVDIRTLPRRIAVDSMLPTIVAVERTIAAPQDHIYLFPDDRPPLEQRTRFDQPDTFYCQP